MDYNLTIRLKTYLTLIYLEKIIVINVIIDEL